MTAVPTPAQIRAQVAAVWSKALDARVIGIRAPAGVETGGALRLGGEELPVARCRSVLEIRERLAALDDGGPPLVLLTPLPEAELGTDLVARLARRHLFSIEPWQLVKEAFQARWIDPRLVERHDWAARALLEAMPEGGYPPVPGGVLEAETAWSILFEALLGLPGGRREPAALVAWAAGDPPRERWRGLAEEVRRSLRQVVRESAGELAGRIFEAALEGGVDVLAVGLAARVLYGAEAAGDPAAIKASGRLEALVTGDGWGGGELMRADAVAWAEAAEAEARRRLEREPLGAVRPRLEAGDALLARVGAEAAAHRSRFLVRGWEQRLSRFAEELEGFLAAGGGRLPASLGEAAAGALGHALAGCEAVRAERLEMARRLCGWLAARRGAGRPASLAAAARAYRRDGSFADRARRLVWEGDPLPALGRAYTRLAAAARAVREEENRVFGELFAGWCATGSHDPSVFGVEEVLERAVAPLAGAQQVLVVVMDGMGVAVFRELEEDLERRGWIELRRGGETEAPVALAAVPAVTQVSRTSLLCGRLAAGGQNVETRGFATHSALVAAGTPPKPPVLFHKGGLEAAGAAGLAPAVRDAIADLGRRVVGVVINAVDDLLAKGGQLHVSWTVDRVRPLEAVLAAAWAAGRAVVVVSDHGHVLEHETEGRGGEGDADDGAGGAERWREAAAGGEPGEGEVLLTGPRVLAGGGQLIAPWSERLRFSGKKSGYHGGAAPQEVVIPLAVFVPSGVEIEGWEETRRVEPGWWLGPEAAAAEAPEPAERPSKAKQRPAAAAPKTTAQKQLFAAPEQTRESEAAASVSDPAAWIDALLASDTLAAQRRLAARTPLPDERLREILQALDERGGKLTRAALARRLGVPPLRLASILSALRRLLNVEGYPVLAIDEASDTVELNRGLLEGQFLP